MSAVGDARKRLHPSPLTHHDPAVRDLIQAAAAHAWEQGFAEGAIAAHGLDAHDNPYRRLS